MSEPFGLFQILQSFLTQAPVSAQEAAQPSDKNSAPEQAQNAEKTELTEHETERLATATENNSAASNNQAILSFMQAHENRARRIKKP